MKYFFKKQSRVLLQRRKNLRNNATPAERELWKYIRKKQLGAKFIRQYSIGSYILDFYSPQQKLAIELDGRHHASPEIREYDQIRTQFLHSMNIRVLRFWNTEVQYHLGSVLKKIREATTPNFPHKESLPNPPFIQREGAISPPRSAGNFPSLSKEGTNERQNTKGVIPRSDQFT